MCLQGDKGIQGAVSMVVLKGAVCPRALTKFRTFY